MFSFEKSDRIPDVLNHMRGYLVLRLQGRDEYFMNILPLCEPQHVINMELHGESALCVCGLDKRRMCRTFDNTKVALQEFHEVIVPIT